GPPALRQTPRQRVPSPTGTRAPLPGDARDRTRRRRDRSGSARCPGPPPARCDRAPPPSRSRPAPARARPARRRPASRRTRSRGAPACPDSSRARARGPRASRALATGRRVVVAFLVRATLELPFRGGPSAVPHVRAVVVDQRVAEEIRVDAGRGEIADVPAHHRAVDAAGADAVIADVVLRVDEPVHLEV